MTNEEAVKRIESMLNSSKRILSQYPSDPIRREISKDSNAYKLSIKALVENEQLKSEANHYKDLIEHRKEVSIINYNLYSDLECERDELLIEVEELKATISKMETITEKVFEETIDRWHSSDVEKVYEYLGITEDEYKWWLEGGYQ